MTRTITSAFILIILFSISCKNSVRVSADKEDQERSSSGEIKSLTADGLLSYTINPENGLLKTKKINEFSYSVKFKPIPYIIAQEADGKSVGAEEYAKKVDELRGLQYYDLRLEVENTNDEILKYDLNSSEQYDARVNYLAFQMQNDIQLIDGNDTLNCLMYHMERAYDIVPYSTILCGFKNLKKTKIEDKTFVLHDNLFNNGIIKLTFLNSDIENIPQLKL